MQNLSPLLIGIVVLLALIELVLKGIALWRAARAGHQRWFIALLVLNTAGILPLIYILGIAPSRKES